MRAYLTTNTWITIFLIQKTFEGMMIFFPFFCACAKHIYKQYQIGLVLSCFALRSSFDFHGCPFLLSSIFSNKGSILVKLSILITIVHYAVPTVPSLQVSRQWVLAAFQGLLIIITELKTSKQTNTDDWLNRTAVSDK